MAPIRPARHGAAHGRPSRLPPGHRRQLGRLRGLLRWPRRAQALLVHGLAAQRRRGQAAGAGRPQAHDDGAHRRRDAGRAAGLQGRGGGRLGVDRATRDPSSSGRPAGGARRGHLVSRLLLRAAAAAGRRAGAPASRGRRRSCPRQRRDDGRGLSGRPGFAELPLHGLRPGLRRSRLPRPRHDRHKAACDATEG